MRHAIALVLAALAAASPAGAGGRDALAPPASFETIRYADIAGHPCIGRVDTPLCAGMTLETCIRLGSPSLCALVGLRDRWIDTDENRHRASFRLSILHVEIVDERRLAYWIRRNVRPKDVPHLHYVEGDALVFLRARRCIDDHCSPWDDRVYARALRRSRDGRWYSVGGFKVRY